MRVQGTAREWTGEWTGMFEEAGRLMGLAFREQGVMPTHPALSQAADRSDEGQGQFPRARPSPSD